MNSWINFYEPFFSDLKSTEDFISTCEKLTPSDFNHTAKIMMHQTQRLVSIADDLPQLRPKRESLQLLFLIICVEHISKLHDGFIGEGQSKKYVKRFCNEFLLQPERDKLGRSFIDHTAMPMMPLGLERAIDILYAVRCDVVHEGKYWSFSFHDGQTPMVNIDPDVIVHITILELREIIVKGCINAIKDKLKP